MSPSGILGFLRRWWLLLLLGPLVAGLAGYAFVSRTAPTYQANTTLLVTRGSTSPASVDDPSGAESLARTYAEALKTRPVLEAAAQRIGQPELARDLAGAVTVRAVTGTQLMRLSVEDRDPARAAETANALVAVFSEQNLELQASRYASSRQNLEQLVGTLRNEMDSRTTALQQARATLAPNDPQLARLESEFAQLQTAYGDSVRSFESLRVAEARGLNSLTVVEPAVPPVDPVRPNRSQTIALALLAGLVTATAAAKLLDYLDDGLPTRERLAQATGLQALGAIPRWCSADAGPAAAVAAAKPADRDAKRAAEAYQLFFSSLMVTRAEAGADDQQPTALMVTSATFGEGKSLTAANLAAAFAEAGRRVILVDADLHRPSQMRRFELPNAVGFSSLLLNPGLDLVSQLRDSSVPGLRVLTSGPQSGLASALLASRQLLPRLAELRQQCDVVIFDTPPVLAQPDVALLGQQVDGVLLVVDARKSHVRQVRQALELLRQAGVVVWGAALNRVSVQAMTYISRPEYATHPAEQAEGAPSSSKAVRTARGQAS